MNPNQFIALLLTDAQAAYQETNVPVSFTIAEAALESGWGESQLAKEGKNLFGVKADKSWDGATIVMKTREFRHGQWVMEDAHWRKYSSWQACMVDHGKFLRTNPRYEECFQCDGGEDFARAVARCGYATDPDYATKLIATMKAHGMQHFD